MCISTIGISCSPQTRKIQSQEQCENFILTIEFHPSFISPCRIDLIKNDTAKTLSIDNFYFKDDLKYLNNSNLRIGKTDSLLVTVDDWFKEYLKNNYGDSVFYKQIENINILDNQFNNFIDSISIIDLVTQKSLEKEGIFDGITIYFEYKSDTINNKFSFRCPDPEDATEFQLIKSLFYLFENSFKKEITNNYIEQLKGYFDFGLLIKHISDNPLEYRFYSHLSENEADEFYNLMESLPRNKPVIFDFSNFGGMGTMFYDDFEEFIDENPNVYWLVDKDNKHSKKQIKEIGVKQNRIFENRNNLLQAINRKSIFRQKNNE